MRMRERIFQNPEQYAPLPPLAVGAASYIEAGTVSRLCAWWACFVPGGADPVTGAVCCIYVLSPFAP